MKTTLHLGDCRDVLRKYPDATFTACCTDPPYGLTFMGKGWDKGVPGVELWAEILRALKPGGMLFAFGGTRTYHRLTCAIEDAGFEIRDCLAWMYGQGFPKSLDVSKAIDKAGGCSPARVSRILRARREAAGMSREQVAESVGCTPSSVRDWEEGRARATGRAIEFITPIDKYRVRLADLLGYTADERRVCGVGGGSRSTYKTGHRGIAYDSKPSTEAARKWQGYGTALKPAFEPCVVAMKPLDGTFAENALQHGVAGVNVDGGRIGEGHKNNRGRAGEASAARRYAQRGGTNLSASPGPRGGDPAGRWPANVALDVSQARVLGQQSGTLTSGDAPRTRIEDKSRTVYGAFGGQRECPPARDGNSGDASRFFYVAKPSTAERTEGMDPGEEEFHPTTKPVDLMRWIVRLAKMPEGTHILDPFAGSGTTGIACQMEGVDCTLIEREREYLEKIKLPRLRGPKDTMFSPEIDVRGLDEEPAA